MAGMGQLMDKLNLALNMTGENVALSKKTFFSRNYGHMITKYKVRRDGKVICNTYSAAEVVKCLAALWKEVGERGQG